jgi:predicted ABC-type exoprotein transport system permease subunit
MYKIFNTILVLIILIAGYIATSTYIVYLNGECPPPAFGISILLILICSGLLTAGALLRKAFRK